MQITARRSFRTIAASFDPRDNALNLLRLLMAGLVIVSHAVPLGGYDMAEFEVGGVTLGRVAVGGFFAISGYLITKSRFRLALLPFLWRRCLRILPGLVVCVLFTAFVAAGVAGWIRGGWSLGEAVEYVTAKLLLMEVHPTVGGTLAGATYPGSWNGALWSIRYEMACYLLAGIAVGISVVRRIPWLTLVAFVGATAVGGFVAAAGYDSATTIAKAALVLPFFLAGAVLLQYSNRIPLNGPTATAAAVAFAATIATGTVQYLAALPLAYLLMWLAVVLPRGLRRLGESNDLSYGVYLYGFPMQQLLVLAGVHELGLPVYAAASLLAVLPLALVSWLLVEQPAMRLKGLVSGVPSHRAGRVAHDQAGTGRDDAISEKSHGAVGHVPVVASRAR